MPIANHEARGRFTGTVAIADRDTGLMWAASPIERDATWLQALALVRTCRLDGHRDWRLPTKAELAQLGKVTTPARQRAGFALRDGRASMRFFVEGEPMSVGERIDALAGWLEGNFGLYATAAVLPVRGAVLANAVVLSARERSQILKSFGAALDELIRTVVAHTPLPIDLDDLWMREVETLISDMYSSEAQAVIREANVRFRERLERAFAKPGRRPGRTAKRT